MGDKPTIRRRVASGIVAGLVVLTVVAIAVFGGFGTRTSQSVPVPLGQSVDTGMMVYVPISATVTFHTKANDQPWDVVITLKVRNPQGEALAPVDISKTTLFGVDPQTRYIAQVASYSLTWDDPMQSYARGNRFVVPPNSGWMFMRLMLHLPASFEPSQSYIVALRQMQYKVTAAYGYSATKVWAPNSFARVFTAEVPLTRLPDTD